MLNIIYDKFSKILTFSEIKHEIESSDDSEGMLDRL